MWSQRLNKHAQLSNEARSVVFALSYPLILYFVFVSSEGSGKTALIYQLASAVCLCDKYQNLMSRFIKAYCRGRAITNVGKTCGSTPCFILTINTFKLLRHKIQL